MKRTLLLFAGLLIACLTAHSQQQVSTGNPVNPGYTGSINPPIGIAFVVQNTNNYDIAITGIDMWMEGQSGGATHKLYYNATSLSGTTNLNTTPGWNEISTAIPAPVSTPGIYPLFQNIYFIIPANTVFRFAVTTSAQQLYYGVNSTGLTNNYTSGGVLLGIGNYQINGANVGYSGSNSNLTTNNSFWSGTVHFQQAVTCPPIITAGMATTSAATSCPGNPIVLGLSGYAGGTSQTYQWQEASSLNGTYNPIGSSQTSATKIVYPLTTTYYRCIVTCNTSSDTSVAAVVNIPVFPAGTYTIDSSQPTGGTNFQTFADAAAAINCGASGPIVFNVAPGTYINDRFALDHYLSITGSSVTINGNGAIISKIATSADPGIIRLNGTKNVTIDSLTINAISSSTSAYAWGFGLSNDADSVTITNCTINFDTLNDGAGFAGIVVSGSLSSTTATGSNCDYLTFSNNVINGGYYGITMMGNTGAGTLQGNVITNNVIRNFYQNGIFIRYTNNTLIENNDVSRPAKTTMPISGCYGIRAQTAHVGLRISKNKVHDLQTSAQSINRDLWGISVEGNATSANPNIISNNVIYNMHGIGTHYYLHNTSAGYTRYYYNTVVSEDTTGNVPSGESTYGFYQTGAVSGIIFQNNNIVIRRGGATPKYGIYMNTTAATLTSDRNNFYINGAGGSNYIGRYNGQIRTTLNNWQTGSNQDANSVAVPPMWSGSFVGDFYPANPLMDNIGLPIAGITTDIKGNLRSATTPDAGAYETSITGCSGTPNPGTATVSGNITSACIGKTISLTLTGYTTITGISIAWQQSPIGANTWTNIVGATTSSESVIITGATDYRALVTCANGGGFDVSNVISIVVNPFYECYCSPFTDDTLHSTTGNYLTNVAIANSSLNSTSTSAGSGGYTQHGYNIPSNTASLTQGQQYTLNATVSSANYITELWIDWNQNGSFDSSEYYQLTNGTTSTVSINVPTTALTGLTGMRLRIIASAVNGYGSHGACSHLSIAGETEDFVITVAPGVQCSGTPVTTGSITATTSTSVCAGQTVSILLSGNPTELGYIYQWEQAISGSGNWSAISGATAFNYTSVPLIASTDFRVAVTCTNPGGGTAYSNVVTTIVSNPQVLATVGDTICGSGSATLSALVSPNATAFWYNSATGGTLLGNGNIFITPVLNTTDTFYVMGIDSAQAYNTARMAPASGQGTNLNNRGFSFTVTKPFTINSVDVIASTGTSITVSLYTQSGATQLHTTGSVTVQPNSTNTINLGWFMVPGTYRIVASSMTGDFVFETTNQITYPISLGAAGQINGFFTNITNPVLTSSNYYWFYNWSVITGCQGQRTPVVAEVNAAPSYTISATPDSVCVSGNATVIINPTPMSGTTIQWEKNLGSGFVAIANATNAIFTEPVTANTIYRAQIYCNNTAASTTNTDTVVYDNPSVAQTLGGARCGTGSVTLAAFGTAGVSIRWYANATGGTSLKTNSNIFTTPVLTASTTYYAAAVSNNCESIRVPVTATINSSATGTGLVAGGTTIVNNHGSNSQQVYHSSCNDTLAVINSGSTALGNTSAFVLSLPAVQTHGGKPYLTRTYHINPATNAPATITLYALQSEFTAYNAYVTSNSLNLPLLPSSSSDIAGMSNIVITQYHDSASAGNQGPLGLYSNTNVSLIPNSQITIASIGNYWKLTFPVNGFSGFFIHTGNTPLAIDLAHISATNVGDKNRIDWRTANEEMNSYFELERSADGKNFEKLADIKARGISSGYTYWDQAPKAGINFYRLKMVNASGKQSYSHIVTAIMDAGSFILKVFPNPVSEYLTVTMIGERGRDVSVSITDITGKYIQRIVPNDDKIELDMSQLAKGVYLIRYSDSKHSQTVRVSKQ